MPPTHLTAARSRYAVMMALISFYDARDALNTGSRDAAMRAMEEAHPDLEVVTHAAGVPVITDRASYEVSSRSQAD